MPGIPSFRAPSAASAWLDRVRQRDPEALTQLFESHSPAIERFLVRMLRKPADVEEALSETFLRAARASDTLSAETRIEGWLYGIALNVAREVWRHRRRPLWALARRDDEADFAASQGIDTAARTVLQEVYAVLDTLSDSDRELVVMRLLSGLELTEIAEARDVSLATVKRHVGAAIERFLRAAERNPTVHEWRKSTYQLATVPPPKEEIP